jgi:hypothetical protein
MKKVLDSNPLRPYCQAPPFFAKSTSLSGLIILRSSAASLLPSIPNATSHQLAIEHRRDVEAGAELFVIAAWCISIFCRHNGRAVATTSTLA